MGESNETKFVIYEYISVPVRQTMETLYADCFKNFGWTLENSVLNISDINSVILKFKRDRRIKNRKDITELQRKCENALVSIERLERSRAMTATMLSLVIGVIGVAFIVGAVFSFLAKMIPLFILLGVVGLVGCALPYFAYDKIREKKALEIAPLIDDQYEIIYDACEQASKMLV